MMLLPRDDRDQTVLESNVDIVPQPIQLSWTQDSFGNHVATALFGTEPVSFTSQARFASIMFWRIFTRLRSTILPKPIRLFPCRRAGLLSHRWLRTPGSSAGLPDFYVKTDRLTLTHFSLT